MAIHNLKITVIDGGSQNSGFGGGAEGGEKENSKKKKEKTALYKALNYNDTLKNDMKKAVSPTTFFAVQSGINVATQTARQFINYYVSDIGRKSGDSSHQATVGRRIEVWSDMLSVGQGALNGAAAGSTAGPVGTVIGAAVGVVSSSINLGFKYAERERAYQHEMFKEKNSQVYNLARANYSVFTGRVR